MRTKSPSELYFERINKRIEWRRDKIWKPLKIVANGILGLTIATSIVLGVYILCYIIIKFDALADYYSAHEIRNKSVVCEVYTTNTVEVVHWKTNYVNIFRTEVVYTTNYIGPQFLITPFNYQFADTNKLLIATNKYFR